MKSDTKKALLVLTLALAPLPAMAQEGTDTGTTTTDATGTTGATGTTNDNNNRGMDLGWLGLLGLAGLAGLRRKEPTVVVPDNTATRR